jgi:hypothetical protein
MSDIYTFTTKDKKFQFSVKHVFYQRFANVNDFPIGDEPVYSLMTKYKMAEYLHNPSGPAIINKETGIMSYWINGKQLSEKDGKRIQHEADFNNNIQDILNS